MSEIELSIIIVTWNSSSVIDQCIDSILESRSLPSTEIIVFDNNSSDRTLQSASLSREDVRVIQNSVNIGFTRANNEAYGLTSGQYILLLNIASLLYPFCGLYRFFRRP